MIDGEDYTAYRVHLLRLTWGQLPGRLWGKWVWRREPTFYDGDEVRKVVGKRWWAGDLWDALRNPQFEIWGLPVGDDVWRQLSRELVVEDRLARKIAAAIAESSGNAAPLDAAQESGTTPPDPITPIVDEMRDIIERSDNVGVAEAAFHFLKHRGERKDHTLVALHQLGWKDATRDQFRQYRKDGARRIRDGQVCRFCPPQLPQGSLTP